ncbi:MAG: KEOPS complex kinase/ATPase Bud32 [Candidatus Thalassarchaeaceae archaeon]|nr:KEOPS complex kinase/ATPase Bud32 [Candidatus Thalassarchaeaceae archaeon]MDP6318200.1 KEOPS complex kinase/ATPase Bud32 [Candidatus Thalassarchaeaceae archaeon]DAC35748.1 MAG TPA: Kae1-associated serine/threonine protein kinase [Candidatus Poseidoniales archaeon]HIH79984.1 Kae1-associated serine/threonine protein kinase [Candidatus Thalassarchaeaceae archaeon]HJM29936.1 KEOPS complex kinase/ATPase Bud32 [Candidatus Thalassarchaeaceae archaeon]
MDRTSIPMWIEENILHKGAEAIIFSGSWLGIRAVLKMREPRSYRHPSLDRRLTRQRLSVEARVLTKLQANNFPAPALLDVDIDQGWMLLSRIEGRPLYDALQDGAAGINEIKLFGSIIRQLHEAGFSHGDLTTHNVMFDSEKKMYLIDFGLSKINPEIENLGLDLQVVNECLTASHHTINNSVEAMIEGYCLADSGIEPSSDEVIERFEAIRGRVRYHA